MKRTHIILAAVIGISVTGCSGGLSSNKSLYSTHQPVVERSNYAIDVNLSDRDGIEALEQKRLTEWMEALGLGYGDRIALDFGGGFSNALANQKVADLAAQRGLLLNDKAPLTEGNIPNGSVRIVVTRSTASVPSCPNWSTKTSANFNAGNHSNYGCAINSNLAAMVADPEDLVRGVDKSNSDPTNGKKAIEAFNDKASAAGEVGDTAAAGG